MLDSRAGRHYYRPVTSFRQKKTALIVALFVFAVTFAFFFHDSHDRIKAETCHLCSFTKVSHATTVTVVASVDLILTVERNDGGAVAVLPIAAVALPSERAPPAA